MHESGLKRNFSEAALGPLRWCARKLGKYSSPLMTVPYWAANIGLYIGAFTRDWLQQGTANPALLNPMADAKTAAGLVAVIGGTVNLFQKRVPVLFNVAGGCVLVNAGMILADGIGKPSIGSHLAGTIPSVLVGGMMLTDLRFLGRDTVAANDNRPVMDFLNKRRRLWIGSGLSISRIFLTASAESKGDPVLLAYSILKHFGDLGMTCNDNAAQQTLRAFGQKGRENASSPSVPETSPG